MYNLRGYMVFSIELAFGRLVDSGTEEGKRVNGDDSVSQKNEKTMNLATTAILNPENRATNSAGMGASKDLGSFLVDLVKSAFFSIFPCCSKTENENQTRGLKPEEQKRAFCHAKQAAFDNKQKEYFEKQDKARFTEEQKISSKQNEEAYIKAQQPEWQKKYGEYVKQIPSQIIDDKKLYQLIEWDHTLTHEEKLVYQKLTGQRAYIHYT